MKIPRQSARSQRSGLSKLPVMAALTVAMGASVAVMPMSAATAAPTGVEGADSTASTTSLPSSVASGYKMTWHDEFDGNKLDTTKWGYQYGCFDPAQRSQVNYTDSPEKRLCSRWLSEPDGQVLAHEDQVGRHADPTHL